MSSHADNEQTDINLPTVELFRLKGKTHYYVAGIGKLTTNVKDAVNDIRLLIAAHADTRRARQL